MNKLSISKAIIIPSMMIFLFHSMNTQAQTEVKNIPAVLGVREQVEVVNQIILKRFEQLLPAIMEQTGFDMWIIACNEDNPDPVYETMIPHKLWCPITQILVLYHSGPGTRVERLNISRCNLSGLFDNVWNSGAWDKDQGESQWECLGRIVRERDPKKIGINIGEIQWAAGGLTVPMMNRITEALGKKYIERLASAEPMTILWGMTLLDEEIEIMEHAQAISHAILAEIFSNKVITPNISTIEDLEYYYWQRAVDLGLEKSFNPSFRIRARLSADARKLDKTDIVIRPGDVIKCDVGLKYMLYNTDHQEWGYVLRPGENDVPESLRKLMAEGNRLQDVYCAEFKEGLTGNEILTNILNRARAQGIPNPRIYSHSVGYFPHEPGPLIGLPWEQVNEPGRGDVKLSANSTYTAELSVAMPVPELDGQQLVFGMEEVVLFTGKETVFMDGRQTSFYLIR